MWFTLYTWVAVWTIACHTRVAFIDIRVFPVMLSLGSLGFACPCILSFWLLVRVLFMTWLCESEVYTSHSSLDFFTSLRFCVWFSFIGECRWSSCLVCKFECLCSRSVIKSFEYFMLCTASCSLSLSLFFCGSSKILSLLVPPSQGLFHFIPFGWSGLLWDLFASFH